MSTLSDCLLFFISFLSSSYAYTGEWCNIDGYTTRYCSDGCCGPYYDEYCCLSGGVGQVVGIVVGCICGVGAIIVILVIIFCCCRRRTGAQGSVMAPTVMTSTTVGGQPGVPVTTPAYPGSYPVAPQTPNYGYSQPYVQPTGTQFQTSDGYTPPPYPQYTAEGYQNAGFTGTGDSQPSAPSNDSSAGNPPSYSEVTQT